MELVLTPETDCDGGINGKLPKISIVKCLAWSWYSSKKIFLTLLFYSMVLSDF